MKRVLIIGASGSGKSHLVQAIANGFNSRFDGHVRIFSEIELQSSELYAKIDIDLLSEHSLIGFDGLNLLENSSIDQNQLGSFIDLALNLGVQIVLTTKFQVSEWESSRLWELSKDAVIANLEMPDLTSRVKIIRRLIALNGILLDDSQINRLANLSENWKDLKSNINLISLALEDGVGVISPSDIDSVLQGNAFIEENEFTPEETSLQDEAKEIIDAVVDVVFDKQAVGGIEIVSDLPELEDDWEPSEIDVDSMIKEGRSLAEKYVKTGLDEMIPAPPNVLSLDERDKFLIQRKEELEINDVGIQHITYFPVSYSIPKLNSFFSSHFKSAFAALLSTVEPPAEPPPPPPVLASSVDFHLKLPPTTSNFAPGDVVPIPTLPVEPCILIT